MLTADDRDTLKRIAIHAPRYKDLLQRKLQEELEALPGQPLDRVQKQQGRAIVIRELLDELKAASA